MSTKGDIIVGNKTNHPIIYLRVENEYSFIGCIITYSNSMKYKNNVSFLPEHFEILDTEKNKFSVVYEDSYFVNLELIKKMEWGPFVKVGKLTRSGIEFLDKQLAKDDPIKWKDYINNKE